MSESVICKVLSMATAAHEELDCLISEQGSDHVADVVFAEILARSKVLGGQPRDVVVQWTVEHAERRHHGNLVFGQDGVVLEPGARPDADVVIAQGLAELVRALFAGDARYEATRDIRITVPMGGPDDEVLAQRRASAIAAARHCVGVFSAEPIGLAELAVRFGSDKWGMHWYTTHYERYFGPYRNRPVKVLEIGIGGSGKAESGGSSLRMWKHYFRRGLVYGLDIYDKSHVAEPRVRVLQGDQGDTACLESLGKEHGPFDIVIDDGSHLNEHVLTSFNALFPHVRQGGLYVIEDVQTSYWPGWGGNSRDLNDTTTSMGFVKTLVDGLNHQELVRTEPHEPSLTDLTVSGLHVHHNLVFIERGANREEGPPTWVSHAETALFL